MEKIVLVALAVLISSMAFAQTKTRSTSPVPRDVTTVTPSKTNPTWAHIGNPFTALDIYGDTVDLAAILASGQNVIIDYSCTWCGPCWNMHNSGILETLDAETDIQVIWVEIDEDCDTAEIHGRGNSQYTYGDWTVTSDGDTIEYPIIDDDAARTCLSTCASLYEGYVPSIYLITPSGYFCSVYGEDWGFGSSTSGSAAVTAMRTLINNAPQAGVAPQNVAISGNSAATVGTTLDFSVSYISVDTVTGISWTLTSATPATATGENASCSWSAAGTYTISVTVTNTTGATTVTKDITVVECTPQALPFTCGFESTDVLGCWSRYDLDGDGYNWDFDFWTASNYTHDGSGCVGTASFINNIGVLTPDQWLISPELIIPATGATLTFWVGGVGAFYNADKYSVYATASGDQPSDFTDAALFTETPTSASYTQKTVDLGAYAGQTIRLGFRHYDSEDGYWVLFDDIEVYARTSSIDDVTVSNVSVYPNPATGIVNVEAEGLQQVEVLDVNGRSVMTVNANTIDMSNLSNGIYMFRVLTNNGVSMQKVVKK